MKTVLPLRISMILLAVGFLVSCKTDLGELPEFNIRKSDGSEVNVQAYIKGQSSLVIHFDSDCLGCQQEAKAISDHLDEFGDIKIVFLSVQDFDKIKVFDKYFKLSEKSNIVVGQDYTNTITTHFKMPTTPLIALVDRGGDVRKVITGEIGIAELKSLINEIE